MDAEGEWLRFEWQVRGSILAQECASYSMAQVSATSKRQHPRVGSWNKFYASTNNIQVTTQPPVVQTLDSAIHRINHYPPDEY